MQAGAGETPCRNLQNAPSLAVRRCDVGVREEAANAATLTAAGAPSVGLVHAAGVLADALLSNQTPALVRRVFAPKAAAEQALSQVTRLICIFVAM